MLLLFPESGRRVPELADPDVRELLVQRHRLIYEVHADTIRVLAFVHGSRDLPSWWEREETARRPSEGSER